MANKRFELPREAPEREAETNPFRRFDNLFKAVIAVPKGVIDEQDSRTGKTLNRKATKKARLR